MDEDIPKLLAGTVLWLAAVLVVTSGAAVVCGLALRAFRWAAGV